MISRTQRTPFGEWWWTVDRLTLAAIGALDARRHRALARRQPAGRRPARPRPVLFRRSPHPRISSPPSPSCSACRFYPAADPAPVAASSSWSASCWWRRRLIFGQEIKGARRWLVILGVNIQPSEFLKPAFVILIAWLFGESAKRPEMPANAFSLLLLLLRRGAVGAAARFRPDHAGRAGVERAVLHGRHAVVLGVRPHRRRRGGPDDRLLHGAACGEPHSEISQSGVRRHFQHRHRHRKLHARRLVRPRAGRGHGQAAPAREPHRFRFRRGGGGIRRRRFVCSLVALYAFIVIRALVRALRNDDRFHAALPPPASPSCSGHNRRSTWR